MNIVYRDILDVETLPTGRTYFTPDGAYPSITTLLGKTSASQVWLAKWREKIGDAAADKISKVATDRGTAVHEYVERHLNRSNYMEDFADEPDNVRLPTLAILKALKDDLDEVWIQETPLWSASLKYAGRVDIIGVYKGVPSIIDLKTSKKKKYSRDIKDYYIQCTAYAYAHNEMYNTDIHNMVIVIGVDGMKDAQVFEKSTKAFYPLLKNRVKEYHKLYG